MDARNRDTALLWIFQYHIHNIEFFEIFWVKKFFLSHFELYCIELEFWILTPKNEKNIFLDTPYLIYIKFFQNFGSKKFFLSHFELYCIEFEFWILTPKNEKNIFLGTQYSCYAKRYFFSSQSNYNVIVMSSNFEY